MNDPASADKLTNREMLQIKHAAFYQAAQQAWYTTALEQTKSIFTLASAGVGLSITLAFASPLRPAESWAPVWLVFAATFFGFSSILCISIFKMNKEIVIGLMSDEDEAPPADRAESLVRRFDGASKLAFYGGLTFLLFAIVAKTWL